MATGDDALGGALNRAVRRPLLTAEVASTHERIGPLLGISPERSRQIEADGLRRLRALAERASLAA